MRKIVFFSPLLVATAIMLLKHAGGSKEIYVVFDEYMHIPHGRLSTRLY